MSDYPFYDIHSTGIKNKDLTQKQKIDLIKKIEKMDESGIELLYAIIKVHELKYNESSSFKLPYSGQYLENNTIQFNLEKFPFLLKQIIYKFIKLHLKKIKEDKKKQLK